MAAAIGLSHAEAERRLDARGPVEDQRSSRSTRAIVRENTLTLFNLILLAFAVALVAVGEYADLLFVGIVIVNAAIGILQELRAKRQLDRLALLVAPRARVIRDGETVAVPVEGVVEGDAIRLEPGEQVVADGPLLEARSLQLDESVLTGEADPVGKALGDEVRSGSFCIAGGGVYRADLVGDDAYASTLTETAREERRDLSPLQRDINRLLRLMIAGDGADRGAADRRPGVPQDADPPGRVDRDRRVASRSSPRASCCSRPSPSPSARRAWRAAERSCSGSPPSSRSPGVDVVCVDKTGTLTDGTLALDEIVPLGGRSEAEVRAELGAFATTLAGRNPTADAIADALGGVQLPVQVEVPFSSRWKWSGLTLGVGRDPAARRPRRPAGDTSPTPDRSRPSSTSARGSGAASCCSLARDRRSRRSATAIPRFRRSSRSGSSP